MQQEVVKVSDDSKFQKLGEFIGKYKQERGNLIKVLYEAQHIFGYLPREALIYIAKEMQINLSEVYGVVSFYSYFSTIPTGKYTIEVCMGTACYVKGAKDVLDKFQEKLGIKVGETTEDRRFTISMSRCIGACSLAPVVVVGEDIYGKMTVDKVEEVIQKYK